MSSRGHFIGQIIDDLDAISSQVRARCKLGQTDLNRVLEDFFKEILNLVYKNTLRNLNDHRSNAPGLDLGDETARVAYQITSQANTAKVNDTLRKITKEAASAYDTFRILIIGERQGSYSIDPALAKSRSFKSAAIYGMIELCRDIMALSLDDLQAVHRKVADEQRRIVIELEPELPDGTFKTSMLQFIEARPSVGRSDATIFYNHPDVTDLFKNIGEVQGALDGFIDELSRLPRMTREFFGWLVDESEEAKGFGAAGLEINADYVEGKTRNVPNLRGEIRLLDSRGFIDFDQDETHVSGKFRISFPGAQKTNFEDAFIHFRNATKFTASTLFSTMNFAAFGPAPSVQPGVGSKDGPRGNKIAKTGKKRKPKP